MCSVLPLPRHGDCLATRRPCSVQLFPCFKTDPHPWRQLFSSQMMIAEQQKAHPEQPASATRVRDVFQKQRRGHCSTFPSLCCSLQRHQAARGRVSCARTPFGPAGPTGASFQQLPACSNPSGREHPSAEPQPDSGSEKVAAKPTSRTASEPAAQTPCQD